MTEVSRDLQQINSPKTPDLESLVKYFSITFILIMAKFTIICYQ